MKRDCIINRCSFYRVSDYIKNFNIVRIVKTQSPTSDVGGMFLV